MKYIERQLTPEVANQVWDILVNDGGANPNNREEFVWYAGTGKWTEFLVNGRMGSRAKIFNQGQRIFVNGDNDDVCEVVNKKLEQFTLQFDLNVLVDRSWDWKVEVFFPLTMGHEEAYQATKHLIRETKTCALHNPNHWDEGCRKACIVGNSYFWRLDFNYHILPMDWHYLRPGTIIMRSDQYWSAIYGKWVYAYEGVVGKPWGLDEKGNEDLRRWASYIRHKSV